MAILPPDEVRQPGAVLGFRDLAGNSPPGLLRYVAPPFSHAGSAFAVALFVTLWLHVRSTWSVPGTVALGLAGALMAMVREQDIFFALGLMPDFGLTLVQTRTPQPVRQRIAAALAGCAAFAAGYLPQLLAYQALNDRPGPSPLLGRKMYWYAPHALQVLMDTSHGFFFWTPLAVLAVAGLILMTAAPRGGMLDAVTTGSTLSDGHSRTRIGSPPHRRTASC